MVQNLTKLIKNLVDNPEGKCESLIYQFELAEKNAYQNVVRCINLIGVVKAVNDTESNEDLTLLVYGKSSTGQVI